MTDSEATGTYPLNGLESVLFSDWIAGIVLAAILVASFLYHVLTSHLEYDEFVNEIHSVRRQGDISHEEFERRIDTSLSPEQRRIRDELCRTADVSSEAATKLARRYESVDRLRDAPPAKIAATAGVSERTAARISNADSSDRNAEAAADESGRPALRSE